MLTEKLTTPFTTFNSLSPKIKWHDNSKFCLVFKGNCLKQKNATYAPSNRISFLIVYEFDAWSRDLNTIFTLKDCLFGGIKLAKNTVPDKYVYTGYGTGFNSSSVFSLPGGSIGKNAIIFRADMSPSVHTDNKKKDSSILGEGARQRLDDNTLTAKAKYPINFTQSGKNLY